MRALLLGLFWLALCGEAYAQTAMPETFSYECKRYRSKCVGTACFAMEPKLQADINRKILTLVTPEKATYDIRRDQATETAYGLPPADPEMQQPPPTKSNFEYVTIAPSLIALENKLPTGQVSEQVSIHTNTGFYSYYVFHTDGSIEGVPVGAPYFAYFGWCDKPGEAPPAPTTPTTVESPAPVTPSP